MGAQCKSTTLDHGFYLTRRGEKTTVGIFIHLQSEINVSSVVYIQYLLYIVGYGTRLIIVVHAWNKLKVAIVSFFLLTSYRNMRVKKIYIKNTSICRNVYLPIIIQFGHNTVFSHK